MKKLFILAVTVLAVVGCSNDEILLQGPQTVKPELAITKSSGIKLESTFTTVEVVINAKVEIPGRAVIKIYDITNKVVSKEEVEVKAGDNLLKVHTAILPTSAYRISLTDVNGTVVGISDFNKL